MKMIKRQQENIEKLLELIKENPELEILPMVDSECVQGEDFAYWMGEWGEAEVDEYFHLDERVYFKSEDYEEMVDTMIGNLDDDFPNMPDDEIEKLAKNMVDNEAWTKAIIVRINNP